jgi:hypothetical protein
MAKLLLGWVLLVAAPGYAQTEINWRILSDVRFTDKYSEEVQAYFYYPTFGKSVKALEGKEVYMKGYMLVIDRKAGLYVLSQNPFASCFFCGSGGPESIVELKLKAGHPKFSMDEVVTVKGRLKLNQDDIYQCNYILEDAEVYEE